MKLLYFDCYAGISGDMAVAALLDLGVPFEHLRSELNRLHLPPDSYTLSSDLTERHGVAARSFNVTVHDHHTHRHYSDIDRLIDNSSLCDETKSISRSIFRRLAEAEALVHGVPLENVHFHEVGAVDSIIDIVATAICLEHLKATEIYAAPLPLGSGFVETAHGRLPVPAPATLELMKGLSVHAECGAGERVTPTGAAIIATLAKPRTEQPSIVIQKIGSGAGQKDFPDCPNILRAFLGSTEHPADQVFVVESNIDDSTPQTLGFAMERLLAAGALDVWFTPVQMKKNRPGIMLSLLSPANLLEQLCSLLLQETSAIGVRHYPVSRTMLERKIETVETRFGAVRFKTVSDQNGIIRSQPEYDDCRAIALEQQLPIQQVMRELLNIRKES